MSSVMTKKILFKTDSPTEFEIVPDFSGLRSGWGRSSNFQTWWNWGMRTGWVRLIFFRASTLGTKYFELWSLIRLYRFFSPAQLRYVFFCLVFSAQVSSVCYNVKVYSVYCYWRTLLVSDLTLIIKALLTCV